MDGRSVVFWTRRSLAAAILLGLSSWLLLGALWEGGLFQVGNSRAHTAVNYAASFSMFPAFAAIPFCFVARRRWGTYLALLVTLVFLVAAASGGLVAAEYAPFSAIAAWLAWPLHLGEPQGRARESPMTASAVNKVRLQRAGGAILLVAGALWYLLRVDPMIIGSSGPLRLLIAAVLLKLAAFAAFGIGLVLVFPSTRWGAYLSLALVGLVLIAGAIGTIDIEATLVLGAIPGVAAQLGWKTVPREASP